jgi:hypothetical protein
MANWMAWQRLKRTEVAHVSPDREFNDCLKRLSDNGRDPR